MTDQATAFEEAMTASLREALRDDEYGRADEVRDDAIVQRVLDECRAIDEACDHCLGEFERPVPLREQRAFVEDLVARLAATPRGTWAVIRCAHPGGQTWYRGLMACGNDGVCPYDNLHDYAAPPDFETLYRKMISYEVFEKRKEVESAIRQARNIAALGDYGINVGDEYRNVDLGRERFARATVAVIDPVSGVVTMEVRKRGARLPERRFIGAESLANRLDLRRIPTVTADDLAGLEGLTPPRR